MTPAPTPQPAHDHGSAGFCTDHALPPDERTETVAGIAFETGNPGEKWATLMVGARRPFSVERRVADTYRAIAAAVVAALDDEAARLAILYAGRLREIEQIWAEVRDWRATAAALEANLAAARAALDRVRALAEDWSDQVGPGEFGLLPVANLRAALVAEETR